MNYHFSPLTIAGARELISWRYKEPYVLYNIVAEPGDSDELLNFLADPDNHYYNIANDHGVMVASCCFGVEAQVCGGNYQLEALDVGVGARPDLTGQGRGHLLVAAILNFGRETYQPARFRATIAAFNKRSQRVFEKNGFRHVDKFVRVNDVRPFVIVQREA